MTSRELPPKRARLQSVLPMLVWVMAILSLASYRGRHPSELWAAGGLDWEIKMQVGIWMGLGLLAAYLAFSHRVDFRILRKGPLSWFGLFVAMGLVSTAYSAFPAYTGFRAGQFAIALLLVLAVDLRHKHLYQAAFIFVALNMIMYFPRVITGEVGFGPGLTRLGSMFGHASVVAIVGAAGAAGLYARWARQGLTRWGWVGLIMLTFATLATISRTAIVALALSFLIVSLLSRRIAVPIAIALVSLLLVAAELNTGSVSRFMVRGQNTFDLQSLSARTVVWEATLDRVREGQIIGEGLGATRWQPPTDILGLGHSHNAILEATISLGLLGGLLVVVILLSWTIRQFWIRRIAHGHWQLHIVDTENFAILLPLAAFCIMDQGFAAAIDQLLLFYVAAMRLVVTRNIEVRLEATRAQAAPARGRRFAARSVYAPGRQANPAASGRR